jgi:hypothetical protein
MANDDTQVVEDVVDDVVDDAAGQTAADDTTTDTTDTTDWKAKFEESEGKRKRAETKLGKKPAETTDTQTKQTDDLGYGELAFLTAKGIEADDEVDFIKTMIKNTGRPLKDIVSDDYTQAKLKTMRDGRAAKDAVPSGTSRSNQSPVDTVEYWLAKGELPTDPILARKVVNARIEKEKNTSVFNP